MRLRGEKRTQTPSPQTMAKAESDSSEDRLAARPETTALVGGADADSDRPAKLARVSADRNGAARSQTDDDANDDDAAGAAGISLPSPAADGPRRSDTSRANEQRSSQVATPDREPSPTAQGSVEALGGRSPRVPLKLRGKRPKGWHLRKENRHLRETVMKGSPVRSERQESADTQDTPQYEPGGILKRLPGRRRAPHHDPSIEADMRRQLELKVAYRAVAKALKPVLAELAQRTSESLDEEPGLHQQFPEYEQILTELDERLRLRLDVLDRQRDCELGRIDRIFEAGKDTATRGFDAKVRDCYDENILRCEHEMLKVLRQAEKEQDGEATDDEGGFFPPLFTTDKQTGQRKALDPKFDSRSRFFVSTDRLSQDTQRRRDFRLAQKKDDDASLVVAPKDFAVFDADRRARARAGVMLITLLDAGNRIEEDAVREAQAAKASAPGLQILASASELADSSILAPMVKLEESAHAKDVQPPPHRERARAPTHNALSISNLVSSDADAPPKKLESVRPHENGRLPPTYEQPPQYPPPRPSWPYPQRPYDAMAPNYSPQPPAVAHAYPAQAFKDTRNPSQRVEDPEPSRQRPRRPSSEYPPHPLGKDYAERRAEYLPVARTAPDHPRPESGTPYGAYPYVPRYEPDRALTYEHFQHPPRDEHDAAPPSAYASESAYSRPRRDAYYYYDRPRPSHDPYADPADRDRRPLDAAGQERSSSPNHYRRPSQAYGEAPQPRASFHQFSLPGRRPGQPGEFAASPGAFRQELPGRQPPPQASPRTMYDPTRPEGPPHVRPQTTQQDKPPPPQPPPLEFRPWNNGKSQEEPEQWRHYPWPSRAEPPKQSAARPAFPDVQSEQQGHFGHFSTYQGTNNSQHARAATPKRERSKNRKRDGPMRRGEGDKPGQEPGEQYNYLFRPYQPQQSQQAAASARYAPIAPPTPSQPQQASPPGGLPAPQGQYAPSGLEQPPNTSATTMQRHPGQRIGHQLLPSTLDPSRAPPSQPQSSRSSPTSGARHHRQRSSTTSAHAPPHTNEAPGGSYVQPNEAGGNRRASPASSGAPAPSRTQPWQQAAAWPGFEAQYPPAFATSHGPAGAQQSHQGPGPAAHPSGPGAPGGPPGGYYWQSAPPSGPAPTFIHAGQNGQQPSGKNLDGRYWRNRRRRQSSPRAT